MKDLQWMPTTWKKKCMINQAERWCLITNVEHCWTINQWFFSYWQHLMMKTLRAKVLVLASLRFNLRVFFPTSWVLFDQRHRAKHHIFTFQSDMWRDLKTSWYSYLKHIVWLQSCFGFRATVVDALSEFHWRVTSSLQRTNPTVSAGARVCVRVCDIGKAYDKINEQGSMLCLKKKMKKTILKVAWYFSSACPLRTSKTLGAKCHAEIGPHQSCMICGWT